ncbi:hypothetical protein [Saccharothrix obliqua]|uniref:hypothetical protein n=1 Tax=Saccharothrix obliqua TaxID=2861747 RepID=UPI001C5E1502|nr:hypothetical protein [Saccharothrix obliqua]MBW4716787.1 hypothetical protein [Saccharothrix obliqua]
MFVGRTELLGLIDRTIRVPATGPLPGGGPVLVVEGVGGSGRTALLEQVAREWHEDAPTVLVRPRLREHLQPRERAIRPVLAAVVLGLSRVVRYYDLSFERVLLAQIAIETDTTGLDPVAARAELRRQDNTYQQRGALLGLVKRLTEVAGDLVPNLGAPGADVAPPIIKEISDRIFSRLQRSRWLSRRVWSAAALDWFGHQGQGFTHDAELVRLELSAHAASEELVVRRGLDDLLVAALLADIRHSLAGVANRRADVVVLVDDGDTPSARAFIASVLRVRRALAATRDSPDHRLPDPVALVVTSGGELVRELTGQLPPPVPRVEPDLADVPADAWWVRVTSADLSVENVIQLARDQVWAAGPVAERIGSAVHELTGGHPGATRLLLDELRETGGRTDDLAGLLRAPGPEPGHSLEHHLLGLFVRGFTAAKADDTEARDALVTVSAARHLAEANTLVALLPEVSRLGSPLLTSPTLWTPPDVDPAHRRLHPLARYLGLRALAARSADHPASWRAVFERLPAADPAARLHHRRLLGGHAEVAAELLDRLPTTPTAEWLRLLDAVAATPDLSPSPSPERAGSARAEALGHVLNLVEVASVLDSDPCVADPDVLAKLKHREDVYYRALAPLARDPALMVQRAVRRGGRRG